MSLPPSNPPDDPPDGEKPQFDIRPRDPLSDAARDALDKARGISEAASRALGNLSPSIAAVTARTAGLRALERPVLSPSPSEILHRSTLRIIDRENERYLAEQRAADERHKAELKAADRRAGLADAMCDALLARIREFEATLDFDEEILVALANFGQHTAIHIEELTYHDPHLLVFDGKGPNGESVRLLQHTSQANVLLAKTKVVEDRPARRVGFNVVRDTPEPTEQ